MPLGSNVDLFLWFCRSNVTQIRACRAEIQSVRGVQVGGGLENRPLESDCHEPFG